MGKLVFLSVLSTLLLTGQGVLAASWPWSNLRKRDDAPFVPDGRVIPLNFDQQGRYVVTVSMSQNTQHFNFTMTTGSGLTYVAGKQCSACSGVNLYDQNASTTVEPFLDTTNVAIFNSTTRAHLVKEDCALTMKNGSLWPYPNQTIIVTDNVTPKYQDNSGTAIGNGVAGMVGLGTNRNLAPSNTSSLYRGNFEDAIGGQWLLANPQADAFSFGLALNSPNILALLEGEGNSPQSTAVNAGSPGSAGTLHMLLPDPSSYQPDTLRWATVDNSVNPENDPQDWTVTLDGWALNTAQTQTSSSRKLVANIDPLYAGLYLPLDQATLIHSAILGSVPLPAVSTMGSLAQSWKVPCDSKFTFGLIVGTQTFELDQDTLVIEMGNGTCVSGIEAWTSSDLNLYLLGARFISAVYLIFKVPRDGPSTLGFASRAISSNKKPIGAIVGGIIGGVALLVFSGIAIWFIRIRYRAGSRPYALDISEDMKATTSANVEPYPIVYHAQSEVSSASPTQSTFYQTISYHPSQTAVEGSDRPSPSQMLFAASQLSTPMHSPNATLVAHNAGPEDVPPAYQSDEQGESPRDMKNRNLYQSNSNAPGSSTG